jgi:hypothetical protein
MGFLVLSMLLAWRNPISSHSCVVEMQKLQQQLNQRDQTTRQSNQRSSDEIRTKDKR